MKAGSQSGGRRKMQTSTSKASWQVLKGGICRVRSNHYERPLPHLITSNVKITTKEGKLEEFKCCSWCGGRKKAK